MSASGARLRALAGDVRARGLDAVTGDHAGLLQQFGVDLGAFGATLPADAAAHLEDWAQLLELVAGHEPVPVPVSARLFLCADNPAGYPEAIAQSWAGLYADLATEHVPGDHFTILQPLAASSVSGLIADV
jgi:thioesterase domain-containing protein